MIDTSTIQNNFFVFFFFTLYTLGYDALRTKYKQGEPKRNKYIKKVDLKIIESERGQKTSFLFLSFPKMYVSAFNTVESEI